MPTEAEIMHALEQVIDPELGRNLVELKMVKDLVIHKNGDVSFTLALTIPGCPLKDKIKADSLAAVRAVPGVKEIEITLGAMSEEERHEALGSAGRPMPKLNAFNQVEKVIAVMSGKGGVGKSSVTAMLAMALANKKKKVGILDADITGSSIPKVFGLPPGGLRGSPQGILPATVATGIKVMSVNLLLDSEDAPVIWRGPMISGAIQQFWTDTLWGKLDVLLVDMPPGTSDAALTVMQALPLCGVVLVTTPQELAAMVVRKVVNMLEQLKIPVLGVVENMSYYCCPDTGKLHEIFGPSHVEEIAAAAGVSVWSRLPVDPQVTTLCDAGRVEEIEMPEMAELAARLLA